MDESRRKRLGDLAGSGNLRQTLSRAHVDEDVADLIVDICLRYTAPPRRRRKAPPHGG